MGGKLSRLVLWVSDSELLAYCEPGVGVEVPVAVHTLGGSSVRSDSVDIGSGLLLPAQASVNYERPLIEEIVPAYSITGPRVVSSFVIRGLHFGF